MLIEAPSTCLNSFIDTYEYFTQSSESFVQPFSLNSSAWKMFALNEGDLSKSNCN